MKKGEGVRALKQVLAISIVILLATIVVIVKRDKDILKANQAKLIQVQQANKIKQENYMKLRTLFSEYEASFSTIMEGFSRTSLMNSELSYSIIFSNGDLQQNDKYMPKSIMEQIKKDASFYDALKKLLKKEEIYQISYNIKSHGVYFYVKGEKTPYITNNNGAGTTFIYCTDKNCKKYGYQQIKENWYMWILPKPEG